MSQSASFYSITASDFLAIQKSDDDGLDISPFIKAFCTLDDTFMGLEYTLIKGLDEEATILIEEIFNPSESYGGADFSELDIDTINPEVLEAMVMNDASVYYLSPETLVKISEVLESIREADIIANYDPADLNENDIYPGGWQHDETNGAVFNQHKLIADFKTLKSFILKAGFENDYVLFYLGEEQA